MKGKIIITLDSDSLDFIAKKGNLTADEVKESLEKGFGEDLAENILFSEVVIEVTE